MTAMNRKVAKVLISLVLILIGIGLQFVSAYKEKRTKEYRPVTGAIREFYEMKSVGAMYSTRMRVEYSLGGGEYESVVWEAYPVSAREGEPYTVYCTEDAPDEAISFTQLEQKTKKAPLPGYAGWLLIGIAVVMPLLSLRNNKSGEYHRRILVEPRLNVLYTGRIEVYQTDSEDLPEDEEGITWNKGSN